MVDTPLINLPQEEEVQGEPKISLDNQIPAPLPQPAAERRATELNFALGDKSPGYEQLQTSFRLGHEEQLREHAAVNLELDRRQQKINIIRDVAAKKGSGLSADEQQMIHDLVNLPEGVDRKVALEKMYADRAVSEVGAIKKGESQVVAKVLQDDPNKALEMTDVARDILIRKKVVQNRIEEFEQRRKEEGWGSWAIDMAEHMLPGVEWSRMSKAVKNSPAGITFPGQTIEQAVSYLHTLPPEQFATEVNAALDKLAEVSLADAYKFAVALDSYSTSDALFDNAMEVFNIATLAPVGAGAKVTAQVARGAGVRAAESAMATGAAAAARSAAAGVAEGTQNVFRQFAQILRAVVRSHEGTGTADAARGMAMAGDVEGSAALQLAREARDKFIQQDKNMERSSLVARVPTLFNPDRALFDGGAIANELTGRARAILDRLAAGSERLVDAITDTTKVARLTPEAEAFGIREAIDRAKADYTHWSHSILDVAPEVTPAAATPTNVPSASIFMGTTTGELFDTFDRAVTVARDFYHMMPSDINPVPIGDGFALKVTRHVDETTPGVRKAMIESTQNKTPDAGVWTGVLKQWIRSADDVVSPFQNTQRHTAIHAANAMVEAAKGVAKNIEILSKEEKNVLKRVLEENRAHVEHIFNERGEVVDTKYGRFFESLSELDDYYQRTMNRLPTEREAAAYFSYVQLNDFDWVNRNFTIFRDKARQGILEHRLAVIDSHGNLSPEGPRFEGKVINDFPEFAQDAGVFILENLNPQKPGNYRRLKAMSPGERAALKELMERDGYKLIQVANPMANPLKNVAGTNRPVNFVLAKDVDHGKLQWEQIPYAPGGHKDYNVQWFVKQPKVKRVEEEEEIDASLVGQGEGRVRRSIVSHNYEGDNVALGFHTEAEARKFAERMEHARQLLRDDRTVELNDYLSRNLPWDVSQFKSLFRPREGEEASLDINAKFTHLYTGRRYVDEHLSQLESDYENFQDMIRSPYNLYDQLDKKYAGERNPDLHTIRESGTEDRPLFQIQSAEMVDPFETMANSMANIMRGRALQDYKLSAMESFIQEFGDLIKGDATLAEVRANPVHYLHEPSWDKRTHDIERLNAAKAAQMAIVNLLGTDSPMVRQANRLSQKVANWVYANAGQKWGDLFAKKFPVETDPFRYIRKTAFHLKMGLFNPVQFFLQAQTLTHVMGLTNPVTGTKALAAATLMRRALASERPNIHAQFGRMAKAFGWSEQEFAESFEAMRKTGWHVVEGEHAWQDDMFDLPIFKSSAGSFLHKGTYFFREGEKLVRMTAWNAAYQQWKKANPGRLLDNTARQHILERADLMTVNMTRASNATLNTGIFSIPTQFTSYQHRMLEQFIGKRLTTKEKAKLMAVYSAAYGVPVGTLGVSAGVLPWYEDIRSEALQRGMDLSGPAMQTIMNGIPTAMLSFVTGSEFSIPERFGPQGLSVISDMYTREKDVADLFLGPSWQIFSEMLNDSRPIMKALTSPFRDEEAHSPTVEDWVRLVSNISTVSLAAKTYYALNTGLALSKKGTQLTKDVDTFEAIFTGITGTQLREVSDAMLKIKSMKQVKEAQNDAKAEFTRNYRRAITAYAEKDKAAGDNAMRAARMWLTMGGFKPNEYSSLLSGALSGQGDMVSKVDWDFVVKSPQSQFQARFDALMQKQKQQ